MSGKFIPQLVRLVQPDHAPNFCFQLQAHTTAGVKLKPIFVQSDWGYPSLASSLGWQPCEKCRETDGTVSCAHKSASQMIGEAYEFLAGNEGEIFPNTSDVEFEYEYV